MNIYCSICMTTSLRRMEKMKFTNLFEKQNVSRLCYGTLSLSDLQNRDNVENKVNLLNYA